MAKIKITDLPQDTQISREEMKKVFGGIRTQVAGLQFQGRTPTMINRNLNPGDLVAGSNFVCCLGCNCEECRPADAIRIR